MKAIKEAKIRNGKYVIDVPTSGDRVFDLGPMDDVDARLTRKSEYEEMDAWFRKTIDELMGLDDG